MNRDHDMVVIHDITVVVNLGLHGYTEENPNQPLENITTFTTAE